MHVVSIANFILLASSVSLCPLRPTTLASRLQAGDYRNYAFRLTFHANAASLEYTGAPDWRQPVAEMVSKRTPHAMS